MEVEYTIIDTPPGKVFVAECKDGLVAVALGDDGLMEITRHLRRHFKGARLVPSIVQSLSQFKEYFDGKRRHFDLPLVFRGTDFQLQVWQALQEIPYGKTSTYGAIATSLGRPQRSRAVGQACGANPLPVVVPCHRVLAGNGGLAGFSGGLQWKTWLLDLERGQQAIV